MAIAFLLPDGHPLMMIIAGLAGGAVGSFYNPAVFLCAIAFGLIARNFALAVGAAVLLGILLQFGSIYGFGSDRVVWSILSRTVALLVGISVVRLFVLIGQAVFRKSAAAKDIDSSRDGAAELAG